MAVFEKGDQVVFSLAAGGQLFRGTVEQVLSDETRVLDEDRWLVRIYPDVHFVVKADMLPTPPSFDIPEEF